MLALKFAYKSQSQWLPLIRALFHFRILDLFFLTNKTSHHFCSCSQTWLDETQRCF